MFNHFLELVFRRGKLFAPLVKSLLECARIANISKRSEVRHLTSQQCSRFLAASVVFVVKCVSPPSCSDETHRFGWGERQGENGARKEERYGCVSFSGMI